MCGSTVTRGWSQNACPTGSGSVAKTSSTARCTRPESSAASRSGSTTCNPRARFTRLAPSGSAPSVCASMSPAVAGVSGSRLTTICACASTVGSAAAPAWQRTPSIAFARSLQPITRYPSRTSERATRPPIWPSPSTATPISSARRCACVSQRCSRWCNAHSKNPRCRPSTAHSVVCAMASFITGSTMRARGTSVGTLESFNRPFTPAHSDWINRSDGKSARLSGGGFATIAISIVGSISALRAVTNRSSGKACDSASSHVRFSSAEASVASNTVM